MRLKEIIKIQYAEIQNFYGRYKKEISLEDIGKIFPSPKTGRARSKQRVSQIVNNKYVCFLHGGSPNDLLDK